MHTNSASKIFMRSENSSIIVFMSGVIDWYRFKIFSNIRLFSEIFLRTSDIDILSFSNTANAFSALIFTHLPQKKFKCNKKKFFFQNATAHFSTSKVRIQIREL